MTLEPRNPWLKLDDAAIVVWSNPSPGRHGGCADATPASFFTQKNRSNDCIEIMKSNRANAMVLPHVSPVCSLPPTQGRRL
jgi:hypothetical protein